jgi:hypothetical protein
MTMGVVSGANQPRHAECAHQRCTPVHFMGDIRVSGRASKARHPEGRRGRISRWGTEFGRRRLEG